MAIEAKKLSKYTKTEIEKRSKARIDLDDECQLGAILGEPVITDANGKKYVIAPGIPELLKQIQDLHPHWTVGETYVDMGE